MAEDEENVMSFQPNDLGNYIPKTVKDASRLKQKEIAAASSSFNAFGSMFDKILRSTMKRQVVAKSMTPQDYNRAFGQMAKDEPHKSDAFINGFAVDRKTVK